MNAITSLTVWMRVRHWPCACDYVTDLVNAVTPLIVCMRLRHWPCTCGYVTDHVHVVTSLIVYIWLRHWSCACGYVTDRVHMATSLTMCMWLSPWPTVCMRLRHWPCACDYVSDCLPKKLNLFRKTLLTFRPTAQREYNQKIIAANYRYHSTDGTRWKNVIIRTNNVHACMKPATQAGNVHAYMKYEVYEYQNI